MTYQTYFFYLFYLLVLLYLIYLRFQFEKGERKRVVMLKEFLVFLGDFSTEYLAEKQILLAMDASVSRKEKAIADYLSRLRLLISPDGLGQEKKLMAEVVEMSGESSMKEFALALYLAMEWGDRRAEGQSVFLEHVGSIRRNAQDTLLQLEEKRYEYALELPICMAPFFCLRPIAKWSSSLLADLSGYYEGSYGAVSMLLIFACVLICFFISFYCRYFGLFHLFRKKEEEGKHFFRNTALGRRMVLFFFYRDYGKTLKLEDRLEEAGWGRDPIGFLKQKVILSTGMGLLLFFFAGSYFKNGLTLAGVLPLSGVLISLLFLAFGVFLGLILPEIYLLLLYVERRYRKKEEQLRLQRLLVLLKDDTRMTGEILLDYLRQFGDAYEKEISLMQESYLRKEDCGETFSRVQKKELGFLIRGMRAVDRVPIAKAFRYLPSVIAFQEKEMSIERRRQEKDRAALSRAVTFVPLFVTVGLYLVLPFVVEGMGQIAAYTESFVGYM